MENEQRKREAAAEQSAPMTITIETRKEGMIGRGEKEKERERGRKKEEERVRVRVETVPEVWLVAR